MAADGFRAGDGLRGIRPRGLDVAEVCLDQRHRREQECPGDRLADLAGRGVGFRGEAGCARPVAKPEIGEGFVEEEVGQRVPVAHPLRFHAHGRELVTAVANLAGKDERESECVARVEDEALRPRARGHVDRPPPELAVKPAIDVLPEHCDLGQRFSEAYRVTELLAERQCQPSVAERLAMVVQEHDVRPGQGAFGGRPRGGVVAGFDDCLFEQVLPGSPIVG
jgi:hypothetical protein